MTGPRRGSRSSAATRSDDRVAGRLPAGPAVLRRVRRPRLRLPGGPAFSTSRTLATSPGRSPTQGPTTRTCSPSDCGAPPTGSRRWAGWWAPADLRVETIGIARRPDEEIEVLATDRGPLFDGSVDTGRGLSLRSASTVLGDLGFDAILLLLHARTADDVMTALDDWVEPVNNVVAADREGAVRYRVAGRVPVRAGANRRGVVDAADRARRGRLLEELPHHDVHPDGQVVTANERRGPEMNPSEPSSRLRTGRPGPPAARRSHRPDRERLRCDRRRLAAADGAALPRPGPWGRRGPGGDPGRAEILAWDGRMEATSRAAAAFAAWRSAFTIRLAASRSSRRSRCRSPATRCSRRGSVSPSGSDPRSSRWWSRGPSASTSERTLATPSTTRPATRRPGGPPTWSLRCTAFHVVGAAAAGAGAHPPLPASGDIDGATLHQLPPLGQTHSCAQGRSPVTCGILLIVTLGDGWCCLAPSTTGKPAPPRPAAALAGRRAGSRSARHRLGSLVGGLTASSFAKKRFRVGVVVVALDRAEAGPAVHRDRLEQGAVGVEHDPGELSQPLCQRLELAEHWGSRRDPRRASRRAPTSAPSLRAPAPRAPAHRRSATGIAVARRDEEGAGMVGLAGIVAAGKRRSSSSK